MRVIFPHTHKYAYVSKLRINTKTRAYLVGNHCTNQRKLLVENTLKLLSLTQKLHNNKRADTNFEAQSDQLNQ